MSEQTSNEQLIEEYAKTNYSHSDPFKRNVKCSLEFFLKYLRANKDNKRLYEIEIKDIKNYFSYLNNSKGFAKEWSLSTKKLRFGHLKIYLINFIQDQFSTNGKSNIDNILEKEDVKKEDLLKILIQQQNEIKEQNFKREFLDYLNNGRNFTWKSEQYHSSPITNKKVKMSKEEVVRILQYFKRNNFLKYLMFRILTENGMRKRELLSIDIDSIVDGKLILIEEDLDKRILRVIGKKGNKVYYIGEQLANLLRFYLNESMVIGNIKGRKNLKVETKALFVSNKKNRFSHSQLNDDLKKALEVLNIQKQISPHTFRRTINTLRKQMEIVKYDDKNDQHIIEKIDNEIAKILLNHKTKDVNIEHYTIYNREEYIELFDKWNPYKELNI